MPSNRTKRPRPAADGWQPIGVAVTPQAIKPIEVIVTDADRKRAKDSSEPRPVVQTTSAKKTTARKRTAAKRTPARVSAPSPATTPADDTATTKEK